MFKEKIKSKKTGLRWSNIESLAIFTAVASLIFLAGFPLPSHSQQNLTTQIEVANRAMEEGKYEDAIKIYSSLLQKNPDNLAVEARLARAYYLAANTNPEYFYKSAEKYNDLIRKVPDFSFPYLQMGQIAYLLALNLEIKGDKKHAEGLYQSALDWFEKYINLEKKSGTVENQKEVATTRILQAITYSRMGEKDKAFNLVNEAKKEYEALSQKGGIASLYDYFTRSGVEYMNTKLYNQALIYLEGAWLINPRPQVRSLFESVIKAKGISLSLPEPLKPQQEEVSFEKTIGKKVEELTSKLETINKNLEILSSMEEKLAILEEKISGFAELKKEVEKLKLKVDSLTQNEKPRNNTPHQKKPEGTNQQSRENYKEISELNQRISKLENKVNNLDEQINKIKSIADMFGILKIQIQELRKLTEALEKKIAVLEETKSKKKSPE